MTRREVNAPERKKALGKSKGDMLIHYGEASCGEARGKKKNSRVVHPTHREKTC